MLMWNATSGAYAAGARQSWVWRYRDRSTAATPNQSLSYVNHYVFPAIVDGDSKRARVGGREDGGKEGGRKEELGINLL